MCVWKEKVGWKFAFRVQWNDSCHRFHGKKQKELKDVFSTLNPDHAANEPGAVTRHLILCRSLTRVRRLFGGRLVTEALEVPYLRFEAEPRTAI